MAKSRDKNDSTMDISASQLVSGNRPPAPRPPGVDKNDVSMWIGGVVGADDFAGTKKRASKSRLPLAIGLAALLAAAGGGAYYMFGRPSSSAPIAAPAPTDTPRDVGSAAIVAPLDAAASEAAPAIATTPADAGAEIAPADAGSAALAADAVSGADPKHPATKTSKKTTKKTVKKPAVKKKSATTKRR
jgi:hypothetical protein